MEKKVFEKFEGTHVTEDMLQEASKLFLKIMAFGVSTLKS